MEQHHWIDIDLDILGLNQLLCFIARGQFRGQFFTNYHVAHVLETKLVSSVV